MTRSSNEMPYVVTSEMSISSNSINNDIYERKIDVKVKSQDNASEGSNTAVHYQETELTDNLSQYISTSKYMTDSLQKNQWPKLQISSSYISQSPLNSAKSKPIQNDKSISAQDNKIILASSPAHSLEKLSKEDEEKIANRSPRTRKLKPPFFDPSATPHKNFLIAESNYQEKDPNKREKTSINNYYDHLNSDFNSQIQRTNSFSNSSFRKTKTSTSKSTLGSSSIQNISNGKTIQSDLFSHNNTSNLTQKAEKIGVIYRKPRPKTLKSDDRPYFTTSQAPLTKRPCRYYEMGSTTVSNIL